MGWWTAFDPAEVTADFGRIAGCGFDSVRIFLTWEDFQPTPSRVDSKMVDRLVSTLDEASTAGLSVMPTLFMGHMSGVVGSRRRGRQRSIPRRLRSPSHSVTPHELVLRRVDYPGAVGARA